MHICVCQNTDPVLILAACGCVTSQGKKGLCRYEAKDPETRDCPQLSMWPNIITRMEGAGAVREGDVTIDADQRQRVRERDLRMLCSDLDDQGRGHESRKSGNL